MHEAIKTAQLETSDDIHLTVDQRKRNLWLLIIYFIIRIPVTLFVSLDPARTHLEFVGLFFACYIVIAALIWNNRKNLASFHFDKMALYLFLLFGTFFRARIFDSSITLYLELIIILFAAIFGMMLLRSKIKFQAFRVINRWNGLAVLLGLGLVFFKGIVTQQIDLGSLHDFSFISAAISFLMSFIIQMGDAGIIEEPIYRGFLWGTLRNYGWQDNRILFFQAFLFWISHLNYLNKPITFWIILPLFSLLLGYLAKKSRSIIPPTIVHVLYNSI